MKKVLALAIGLAFSATAAVAEDRAIPGATGHASRSGATTQESGAGEMGDKTSLFDKLDHDRDGYLTAEELQLSADLKLKLEHIDADGDGKVSREEFLTAFEEGAVDEAGAAGRGGSSIPPRY